MQLHQRYSEVSRGVRSHYRARSALRLGDLASRSSTLCDSALAQLLFVAPLRCEVALRRTGNRGSDRSETVVGDGVLEGVGDVGERQDLDRGTESDCFLRHAEHDTTRFVLRDGVCAGIAHRE